MKNEAKIADPELTFRTLSQMRKLGRSLIWSRLDTKKEQLLERVRAYIEPGYQLDEVNPDALVVGFWEALLKHDYETIVKIGDRLDRMFLFKNPEIEALYGKAKLELSKKERT